MLFSPHLAWRNSTLRKDLAGRLQRPLWVGNDADAAAWAEYRYGAARGADLALMITLGTGHRRRHRPGRPAAARLARRRGGVGAHARRARRPALRLRQPRLLGAVRQRHGPRPDRPRGRAHVAGGRRAGCWSGSTASADRLTGEDVARAAADGDPLALELVTEVGVWLGQGIADLAAVLDPEVVVIGGGVSKLGEMVLRPGARAARPRAARPRLPAGPRVVAAELGPQAGIVGAADLVRRPSHEGESPDALPLEPSLRTSLRQRARGRAARGTGRCR